MRENREKFFEISRELLGWVEVREKSSIYR